jgi:hypothetical protein
MEGSYSFSKALLFCWQKKLAIFLFKVNNFSFHCVTSKKIFAPVRQEQLDLLFHWFMSIGPRLNN